MMTTRNRERSGSCIARSALGGALRAPPPGAPRAGSPHGGRVYATDLPDRSTRDRSGAVGFASGGSVRAVTRERIERLKAAFQVADRAWDSAAARTVEGEVACRAGCFGCCI